MAEGLEVHPENHAAWPISDARLIDGQVRRQQSAPIARFLEICWPVRKDPENKPRCGGMNEGAGVFVRFVPDFLAAFKRRRLQFALVSPPTPPYNTPSAPSRFF